MPLGNSFNNFLTSKLSTIQSGAINGEMLVSAFEEKVSNRSSCNLVHTLRNVRQ